MSAQEISPTTDRLHALDLLRFVAALSVAFAHWYWVTPDEIRKLQFYPEQWFRYGGLLGVIFFFIISGFVILRSAQASTPLRFAGSRAIRLYPAFWICCAITFLLTDPWLHAWRDFLVNLTMFPEALGVMPMDEAYWTLVLEVKFYLLIWLLLITRCLKHIEVFLWAWLLYAQLPDFLPYRELISNWPSAASLSELVFDNRNSGRDFSTFASFFIGGCACCLLVGRRTIGRWSLLCAAMAASAFETLELAARTAALYQYRPVTAVTLIALLFFLVVLAIALGWVTLPASKSVIMLGAISYPLYLLNMYIGSLLLSGLQESIPFPLAFILVLAVVLGLSYCVVVYAEAPIQAWMRERLKWLEGPADKRFMGRSDSSGDSDHGDRDPNNQCMQ